MIFAESYYKKTQRSHIYNIMPIANLNNIMKYGILSKNGQKAKGISAISVADEEVQERRANVRVPNGLKLHDYANLYFDFWNPMLSKLRSINEEICILCVRCDIIHIPKVVFSDMNASRIMVSFYDVNTGLNEINFERIFMRHWTADPDAHESYKKRI